MIKAKYSNSQLAAAEKFLAKYGLTLDSLDEPQKKTVVAYANSRRWLTLCLIVFGFGLVVSITGVYLVTNRTYEWISQISERVQSGEVVNPHFYGVHCFKRGFSVGMHAFGGLYILCSIVILPILLRQKRQIISAFLPVLKSQSTDELPSNE